MGRVEENMGGSYTKTKILAFLAKILLKLVTRSEVSGNEIQSLENIVGAMGEYLEDENEFRY